MNYISTRGNFPVTSPAEAIVLGMVPRGGLFVPENIPKIDMDDIERLDYRDIACTVLGEFLTAERMGFSKDEIRKFTGAVYNPEKFENDIVTPLKFLGDQTAVLELWHGPTAAFKDIALQLMPHLLVSSAGKLNKQGETVILVATSGDTGKAAMEGFRDIPGVRVVVFYPENGVSKVQLLQMLTTSGNNTSAIAVKGNFDDCQTMVKNIFADKDFCSKARLKGIEFSSANSINWGRLVPQIVYYFHGYNLMKKSGAIMSGDKINISVPTGNFGNILAAFYAKEMGLPVNKLICASNINSVLSDFINTGTYNRKREFFKTSSPSMDILVSSNLERFLFEITGHNASKINRWYGDLAAGGNFKVDDSTRQRLRNILYGNFSTEKEVTAKISEVFGNTGYLIDTHTAVGLSVLDKYNSAADNKIPALVCGTASPFKFNNMVYLSVSGKEAPDDEFEVLKMLSELSGSAVHRSLQGLDKIDPKKEIVISKNDGESFLSKMLEL